jgi:ubiquinone/menaquinone biosynthesis C-methylase UbiE
MACLCADYERVLDVGCKDSPNYYLHNREVIGLDFEAGPVPSNYASFHSGNALDLPGPFEPESFDAVHAGEIIEHVERPVDFLRACNRTLRPAGMIVLSTPNPNWPFEQILTINLSRRFFYDKDNYRPMLDHVCLYPQRWLIRMMEIAGFTNVRLHSGGIPFPFLGTIPFPRPWCYQTIATGFKSQ